MLKQIVCDPAGPSHWGANRPGMQAKEELTGWRLWVAKKLWRSSAFFAAAHSWAMMKVGLHKQVANRPTEPYQYIHAIISGTNWENLYHLRDHEDAQPEFRELVQTIKKEFDFKPVQLLKIGEWHLPYITPEDKDNAWESFGPGVAVSLEMVNERLRQISAARCARVSYLTHEGTRPNMEKDLGLYDRLAGSHPIHASPLEHQATPDRKVYSVWRREDLHGNLAGWIQSRKLIPGEHKKEAWEK